MLVRFLLALILCTIANPTLAQGFWDKLKHDLGESIKGSRFECTKYERQKYEIEVLRDRGAFMPFTEVFRKKKVCIKWERKGKGAIGRKCAKYSYVNYDEYEHKRRYRKETRYRTVCVDGYTVK